MNTLYFDCSAGISGDMFLGAMLDLGIDENKFLAELAKIPLEGYDIAVRKEKRGGISGTRVEITTSEKHPHRGLKEIHGIIDRSGLKPGVKDRIRRAFAVLAEAEGKVHGCSPEDIHFHEVGAVDSIIDISGAFILADLAEAEKIVFSVLNTGSGTVECAHGTIPVPAPATVELLRDIPVFAKGEPVERTTPTGALIARSLADSFSSMPSGRIISSGTGIGKRETDIPNILRVFRIQQQENLFEESVPTGNNHESAVVIETNIDDMSPQEYETVMDSLFAAGAMDVWLCPIIMKKGRPAVTLHCLCENGRVWELAEIILRSTSTLGVRTHSVDKLILEPVIKEVTTSFGKVRIKEGWLGGELLKRSLEYDDLKRISSEKGIPLLSLREKITVELARREERS